MAVQPRLTLRSGERRLHSFATNSLPAAAFLSRVSATTCLQTHNSALRRQA